ncbi:phage tail sheath subtilisin-like domain-containing protein [Actinosynnema sp. NPDC050801]|uniref:phage tail sheath family protein n=1 Tax=unclassified Actinosynnema TaxID=2637065 RepID=UPI0033D1B4E6
MATYLRPGVYVEEVGVRNRASYGHPLRDLDRSEPTAPRRIAEHGVAAFVGLASDGPAHVVTMIRGWTEFEQRFGGVVDGAYLGHAVHGFFTNGGRECHVVRVNDGRFDQVTVEDLVGSAEERTGIASLEAVEDVSVIAAPDVMALRAQLGEEGVKAAQLALVYNSELMGDRIALIDCPPDLSPHEVRDWRTDVAGYDSKFAVLYYPWLKVSDHWQGTTVVPPSGHLAGVHARTDLHRHAANDPVRGAFGVERDLLLQEQELLHPLSVNALVRAPGGPVVWGARTLSSDPKWRYLRSRRLMNFLVRNIRAGVAWVVFGQAHDREVWRRVRRELEEFLSMVWRSGALFGDDPDEAFYVKCDQETNPSESVDANLVVADCGVAGHDGVELNFRVVCYLG